MRSHATEVTSNRPRYEISNKMLLEIICCILHPLAVVLIWINLLRRKDLTGTAKLTWGITALVPLVPFVYVLTGNDLW